MSVTRNELLGKKVYNPDAAMVGEVSDIAFSVGASQPTLVVRGADGSTMELPWDSVSSARDIVLLKENVDSSKFRRAAPSAAAPQVQAQAQAMGPPMPGQKKFCTGCGKQLRWIEQYKRWYCDSEKKYV